MLDPKKRWNFEIRILKTLAAWTQCLNDIRFESKINKWWDIECRPQCSADWVACGGCEQPQHCTLQSSKDEKSFSFIVFFFFPGKLNKFSFYETLSRRAETFLYPIISIDNKMCGRKHEQFFSIIGLSENLLRIAVWMFMRYSRQKCWYRHRIFEGHRTSKNKMKEEKQDNHTSCLWWVEMKVLMVHR